MWHETSLLSSLGYLSAFSEITSYIVEQNILVMITFLDDSNCFIK